MTAQPAATVIQRLRAHVAPPSAAVMPADARRPHHRRIPRLAASASTARSASCRRWATCTKAISRSCALEARQRAHGGDDLREPDAVRAERGSRALPARRGARPRAARGRGRRCRLLAVGGEMYPPASSTYVDVERLTRGSKARAGRRTFAASRPSCSSCSTSPSPTAPTSAEGRAAARRRAPHGARPRRAGRGRRHADRARARRPGDEQPQRLPDAGAARGGPRALAVAAPRGALFAAGQRDAEEIRASMRVADRGGAAGKGRLRQRRRRRVAGRAGGDRPPALVSLAVRFGGTRLIDNMTVVPSGAGDNIERCGWGEHHPYTVGLVLTR